MFTIHSQPLPGTFVLEPRLFEDNRGDFVKTYHKNLFLDFRIDFTPTEEFFSTSHKDVLRGMHFQLPPHAHSKLVYCIRGAVLDVIVDLRKESPSYGKHVAIELSEENHLLFFIPKGFGHGFLSLEDNSVMVYKTDHAYVPESDTGIRYDSFGYDWPAKDPLISERDLNFETLKGFPSPF
jgi:dTDP-4-dehydrorhamnose 3,5-epimerase/CDP-3, 6-dideoxy-D-glycero-D-glycero-4-hexulose-5-epimerase